MDNISAEEVRFYGLLDSILDSLDRRALVQVASAHGLVPIPNTVSDAVMRESLFLSLLLRARPNSPLLVWEILKARRIAKDATQPADKGGSSNGHQSS